MQAISPPLRRALALTLAAAALAAAWLLVVRPVIATFAEYDRSISQSRALLERYLRVGSSREALEQYLRELRRAQSAAGGFLEGESPELAAAILQNTVKTVVVASGGTLRSTQILSVEDAQDSFRRVGVRVTMMATTRAMQKIFYALETENPYLFLDTIDVRSRRARSRRKEGEEALQVRYNVHGYMRIVAQ